MIFLEGDEDLAVGGRDLRAVAERQVDAAVGDADVVEHGLDLARRNPLAEELLDLGEISFGLLEPRARGGADVQADLAGVDGGEKVATDVWEQERGADDEDRRDR